ncbi:MAG: TetR/AcrR family transcriptional regulator [Candidatus Hodarchaeota archaeon]
MSSTKNDKNNNIVSKKSKKIEWILDAAQELYESEGREKLTSEAVAEKLNMSSRGHIYHYFKSKRELWIALRARYFQYLQIEFNRVEENHKGSNIDLLIKLMEKFLDFSASNRRRFRLMFLMQPPPSKVLGPYESGMNVIRPFHLLDFVERIVEKAIDQGEIYKYNSFMLTAFLNQITLGTAIINHGFSRFPSTGNSPSEFEKVVTEHKEFIRENREFSLNQLRKFINMMKK